MVPGLTELGERLGPWFADGAARAAAQAAWNEPVTWPIGVAALGLVALVVPAWAGYRRRERRLGRVDAPAGTRPGEHR